VLMLASISIAGLGIGLAYLMYRRKAIAPERFSEAGGGVPYRLIYNKYYIDELYQATFVRFSLFLCWLGASFDRYVIDFMVDGAAKLTAFVARINGWFDNVVIDGMVNIVADGTFAIGNRLRQVQTGNINSYLYVIVGAVAAAQFLPRLSPNMLVMLLVAVLAALVILGIAVLLSGRRITWRPPALSGDESQAH
jgi:NADH-quinone oxidoreductase subunit L